MASSGWSEPAAVEAGLLQPGDWTAQFVTPDWDEEHPRPARPRCCGASLTLRGGVMQARLYVTALGVYEAQI